MPEPATRIDTPTVGGPTLHLTPIPLLRWPGQEAERHQLVALGQPRILVISQYAIPPGLLDDLELWILDSANPDDIHAAIDALQRKVQERRPEPVLDDDGLLWFDGHWTTVPDTQLPVVDLLVRNVNTVVRNDDLLTAYQSIGGSDHASAFRTLINRIRRRMTRVGLHLHVVRRHGAMLATTPAEPPEKTWTGTSPRHHASP
jgi:hypothetical protein